MPWQDRAIAVEEETPPATSRWQGRAIPVDEPKQTPEEAQKQAGEENDFTIKAGVSLLELNRWTNDENLWPKPVPYVARVKRFSLFPKIPPAPPLSEKEQQEAAIPTKWLPSKAKVPQGQVQIGFNRPADDPLLLYGRTDADLEEFEWDRREKARLEEDETLGQPAFGPTGRFQLYQIPPNQPLITTPRPYIASSLSPDERKELLDSAKKFLDAQKALDVPMEQTLARLEEVLARPQPKPIHDLSGGDRLPLLVRAIAKALNTIIGRPDFFERFFMAPPKPRRSEFGVSGIMKELSRLPALPTEAQKRNAFRNAGVPLDSFDGARIASDKEAREYYINKIARPQGWDEKAADIVGGLAGFVVQIMVLKKILPKGLSPIHKEILAWEIASQIGGDPPGRGAAMSATIYGINRIPVPGKVGWMMKVAATSGLFAGVTAAGGGDAEAIITSAALPAVMRTLGLTPALMNKLVKARTAPEVINQAKKIAEAAIKAEAEAPKVAPPIAPKALGKPPAAVQVAPGAAILAKAAVPPTVPPKAAAAPGEAVKVPWKLSETAKSAGDMGFTRNDQIVISFIEARGGQVNISGVPMRDWYTYRTPEGLLLQSDTAIIGKGGYAELRGKAKSWADAALAKMGGKPVEAAKPPVIEPPRAVGIKKVSIEEQRGEPAAQVAPKGRAENLAAAKVEYSKDPDIGKKVEAQLRAEIRPHTDREVTILQIRAVDLDNRAYDLAKKMQTARKAGNTVEVDRLNSEFVKLREESTPFWEVVGTSGREWGRAGVQQQQLLRPDYTYAALERDWTLTHKGETPSPKVVIRLKEQADKIAALQKQVDDFTVKADETAAIKDRTKRVEQEIKEQKGRPVKSPQELKEHRERILERIGIKDAEGKSTEQQVRQLVRSFVEEGIRETQPLVDAVWGVLKKINPAITRDQAWNEIAGYGKIRLPSKEEIDVIVRDLTQRLQLEAKLRDAQRGEPMLRSGQQRPPMSDKARQLQQQVEEARRKGGYEVTDPETQLKTAMNEVHNRLKNAISDIEDELAAGARIVKGKTVVIRDAEAQRMQTHLDMLREQRSEMFGLKSRELTDAQRVQIALRAAEKSLAASELLLEKGAYADIFGRKEPPRKLTTPELEAARARRDASKAQVEAMRELLAPGRTPEEIAEKIYLARTAARIAEYKEMLATGNFARKPTKPPRELNKRELKAQAELAHLKWLVADQRKGTTERVFGYFMEVAGFSKIMQVGADVSTILNQFATIGWHDLGGLVVGKPTAHLWKTAVNEFASFFFRRKFDAQMLSLKEMPSNVESIKRLPFLTKYKLWLEMGAGVTLSQRAESYPSRLIGRIPGFRAGNRAAVIGSNSAATYLFETIGPKLEKAGLLKTEKQQRNFAKFIGKATGRAVLPDIQFVQEAADIGNVLLYSVRFPLSRVTNVLSVFGVLNRNPILRREGLKTLAGGVIEVSGIALIASAFGYKTGYDPEEADFLKTRVGNTYYDLSRGHGVVIRFLARMGLAAHRAATGRGRQIDREWVVEQAIKSKFAPLLSGVYKVATGKTIFGRKIEGVEGWTEEARNQFLFMWVNDGIDAFRDAYAQNPDLASALVAGAAATTAGWMGVRVQTYRKTPTMLDLLAMPEITGMADVFNEDKIEGSPESLKRPVYFNPISNKIEIDDPKNPENKITVKMNDKEYDVFTRLAGQIAATNIQDAELDTKNPTRDDMNRLEYVLDKAREEAREDIRGALQAKANYDLTHNQDDLDEYHYAIQTMEDDIVKREEYVKELQRKPD